MLGDNIFRNDRSFWQEKKFDFRIQIETNDVVYSGRLIEESCRRCTLDVHTATNRQNWAMCELVIPVSVNVSF